MHGSECLKAVLDIKTHCVNNCVGAGYGLLQRSFIVNIDANGLQEVGITAEQSLAAVRMARPYAQANSGLVQAGQQSAFRESRCRRAL
jgi:hypothetical protein